MIGKQGLLLPSDIPKYLNIHGTKYNIKERKLYIGSFICSQEEFGVVTIKMLHPTLIKYKHFLLCIQDSTVAVIHAQNGFYYLFDPHSRNITGFQVSNGCDVLLSFMLLTILQTYLSSLAGDLSVNTFELTPLHIRADVQHLEMQAGFSEDGKKIHIGVFAYLGTSDHSNMMEKYFTEQLQHSSLKIESKIQRKTTVLNNLQNDEKCYSEQCPSEYNHNDHIPKHTKRKEKVTCQISRDMNFKNKEEEMCDMCRKTYIDEQIVNDKVTSRKKIKNLSSVLHKRM